MPDYNTAPLYAGAESGLDALIAGVEKKREEEKKLLQNAKYADAILKLNPQLLPPDMTLEQLQAKAAPERIALSMAGIANLHLKSQQQQLRLSEEQSLRLSDSAANDARQPAMLARLGQLQQPGERPPPFGQQGPAEGPDTPGLAFHPALMRAAAETDYRFNPAVLDDVIRQGAGGAGGPASFFRPDQFGKGQPVLRPDGTPIPGRYLAPTGPNQAETFDDPSVPQPPKAAAAARVIVGQNQLTGEPQVTWSGSPEDFEKAFPHLAKPGGGKGGTTPPNVTESEYGRLKKGDKYWWNGKQLTKE